MDIPDVFQAGRYHSWVVEKESVPESLQVTAVDETGEIMAFRHKAYKVFGLQFHPESVMTPEGKQMIANFLAYAARESTQESKPIQAVH